MSFEMKITTVTGRVLTGVSVHTNMTNAPADCEAVWDKLKSRLSEIKEPMGANFYGVSYNMGEDGEFDYLAAIETKPGSPVPAGMGSVAISAGRYAFCHLKNLELISSAFTYIYCTWANQDGNAVNMGLPCFEEYKADFAETGEYEIFVPLL